MEPNSSLIVDNTKSSVEEKHLAGNTMATEAVTISNTNPASGKK